MVKSKKWVLVKMFEGIPKKTDLKLEEEELSPDSLKDGGNFCSCTCPIALCCLNLVNGDILCTCNYTLLLSRLRGKRSLYKRVRFSVSEKEAF